MKKFLVCALAVGFTATFANAATLSINFDDGSTGITIDQSGGPVDVDISLGMIFGDTLSGVGMQFSTAGSNVGLVDVVGGTNELGWTDAPSLGNITDPGHGYSTFSSSFISGAGTTVDIGTINLSLAPAAPGTVVELMINDGLPGPLTLIKVDGNFYSYGPNIANTVPGFYQYGTGAPFVANAGLGGTTASPITITYTPEPASLALLAIGGVALLRRRR